MDDKGRLFIISTPIGNLKDITLRALDVLNSVSVLACEDTRHTKKLLAHYRISVPEVFAYHQHNESSAINRILTRLSEGKDVGLVCDAGTPGISDAGYLIVKEARKNGYNVLSVPGPSALCSAVSVSGLPSSYVLFIGFLPRKKSRKKKLLQAYESIKTLGGTIVLYEAPHRVEKLVSEIEEVFGPNVECALIKELTKQHETAFSGPVSLIKENLSKNFVQGEFVVCIYVEK